MSIEESPTTIEEATSPYIGERSPVVVQAHWAIERAYFQFVEQVFHLATKQYVTGEELCAVLKKLPAPATLTPPDCDCGHEFSDDPKWWHLGGCSYRSFYLD